MRLSEDFFKIFEKNRIKTKEKLGLTKLSQSKYSKMIAKKGGELFEIC